MVERHTHSGVDSHKLKASDALQDAPQEAVTPIAGTAGGSYGVNEQGMLQDTSDGLDDLITKLQAIGLLK